jgi:hypothetical protein
MVVVIMAKCSRAVGEVSKFSVAAQKGHGQRSLNRVAPVPFDPIRPGAGAGTNAAKDPSTDEMDGRAIIGGHAGWEDSRPHQPLIGRPAIRLAVVVRG